MNAIAQMTTLNKIIAIGTNDGLKQNIALNKLY